MENIETIVKSIKTAGQTAIILPKQLSLDALSSAIVLEKVIKNLGNKATIFSSSENIPTTQYLKSSPVIHSSLSDGKELLIKVSNQNAEPKEIKYEKVDGGLSISISTDKGNFKETDVSVVPNAGQYDLLVILNCPSLEDVGQLYSQNTKLFFDTPSINIDINPTNEYFSKLNFINPVATCLSEVVYDLVKKEFPDVLKDEEATTSLLAGIISQTSSFRDPKTTPQVLMKSSELVASGAKQQDIIRYLFKTKSLQQLQLWGRALARLTEYPEKKVLTAVLTSSDLEKTKSNAQLITSTLKDLIEVVTGYSLIILIAENAEVLIAGLPHENIVSFGEKLIDRELLEKPKPLLGQYQFIQVQFKKPLVEIQQKLVEIIQDR